MWPWAPQPEVDIHPHLQLLAFFFSFLFTACSSEAGSALAQSGRLLAGGGLSLSRDLRPPGANPARPRFTLCLSVKTLPLVSRRDEPNLGEEGQACARWTGCPKVTDVSLTLENTHLFPSPLGIRWSFPEYGPSPGTKQSALEIFHGLSVHGGHTHTHNTFLFAVLSSVA